MGCFEDLLAPFDRDRFFAEHWRKKSLHVPAQPDKFAQLPGLADLPGMLFGQLSPTSWTTGHTAPAQVSLVNRNGKMTEFAGDPAMWGRLYNAGASLCFGPVDRLHAELSRFVEAFRKSTPVPGEILTTCYVTPPGSGSSMHFDCQNVFFIQISGEKHWKFGTRPAMAEPPTNLPAAKLADPSIGPFLQSLGVTVAPPEETGLQEIVLRAGDVLYLPAGAWHEARTEDSHSMHYTLTFSPLDASNFVHAFMRLQLLKSPLWRRDLRYEAENGTPTLESLAAVLDDLRATLAHTTPKQLAEIYAMTSKASSPEVRSFFERGD